MGIDNFRIRLNTPNAIFTPGSTVSGVVLFTVRGGRETTHAIRIKLSGIAEAEYSSLGMLVWVWLVIIMREVCSEDPGGIHSYLAAMLKYILNDVNNRYSASIKWIDTSRLLFGDDTNAIQIPEGDHEFPFSFELPDMLLPPSCRINSKCYVSYELQASISKPWYMRDNRTEVTKLKVIPPLNLNYALWARMPTEVTNRKSFGLLWWLNEPLIVKATVDPSGYCVGNRIPVTIEMDNRSDRELKDVTVELIRVWTMTAWNYWGLYSTWEKSEVVTTVHRSERVPKACVTSWVAPLSVPLAELPTLISICLIIRMEYKLRVTACVDSILSTNLSLDVPVTIGNVPFHNPGEGGSTRIEL